MGKNNPTRMTAEPKVQEIVITRIFDAPREQVWKAWTEPELFMKWWGPKDFTAPVCKMNFRVGGEYFWCMRGAGPDGVVRDFCNSGQYLEIVPNEKIAVSMSFADDQADPVPASFYGMPGEWPMEVTLAVTFEKIEGGKTRMTVRQDGIPGEMTEMSRLGWEQSLDKLAEALSN